MIRLRRIISGRVPRMVMTFIGSLPSADPLLFPSEGLIEIRIAGRLPDLIRPIGGAVSGGFGESCSVQAPVTHQLRISFDLDGLAERFSSKDQQIGRAACRE